MFDAEIEPVAAAPVTPDHSAGSRAAAELGDRLGALSDLTYAALRIEWRRLYRAHPPKKMSRDLLELGVAWKLQEKALGGLGASSKRRLADLALTMATRGDLVKARAVTLRPGARLVRQWHGETHEIVVLEDGYRWRGEHWRSLSAIARAITGTQWSGPRFFGLYKAVERALRPGAAAQSQVVEVCGPSAGLSAANGQGSECAALNEMEAVDA
jgi:hypothetical protein